MPGTHIMIKMSGKPFVTQPITIILLPLSCIDVKDCHFHNGSLQRADVLVLEGSRRVWYQIETHALMNWPHEMGISRDQ